VKDPWPSVTTYSLYHSWKPPPGAKIHKPGRHYAAFREDLKERAAEASRHAQVEQYEPSSRNINSDLSNVASEREYYLSNRGERNVPKIFLKKAFWKDGPHTGYYVRDHIRKEDRPIEFDHLNLEWGTVKYSQTRGAYRVNVPAPEEYGLTIPESKKVDRSEWGPIDRTTDDNEEGPSNPTFRWNSDQGEDDPPQEDIPIPQTDPDQEHEDQLQSIAERIPTLGRDSPSHTIAQLPTISTAMSRTATITQTHPTAILGRINRSDLPFGGASGPPGGFGGSGGGNALGSNPPPGGPPGGGGNPGGNPGGGGGGGGNPPGQPGNPQGNPLQGAKLGGKEPVVFNGDRSLSKKFAREWALYAGLNRFNDLISIPYTRALMMLTFIQGEQVNDWVETQIQWLASRLQAGHNP